MAHVRFRIFLAFGLLAAAFTGAHEPHSTDIVGVLGLDIYADASGDVVDALLAVQEAGAKSVELRHIRSRDAGKTWSRPAPILPGGTNVFSPRRGAEPQIAAAGNRLVVVWTEPGTSPWGSGALASAVSADAGKSWKKGVNPADDGTTKDHGFVDVAATGPGAFLAVWLDGRDGGQGLRSAASKDGGASWSKNVDIERRTCECCANRLLVRDGSSDVDVIYRGRDPRDMYVARTSDGGSSWTKLGPVARFGWEFDGCPEVAGGLAATGAAGGERLHALAWTGKDSDVGVWRAASDDRGRTWTQSARMGDGTAKQLDLASNGGCVTAVWEEYRAEKKRHVILAATSCDGGTAWSKPELLSSIDADATHPLAAATRTGVLAAWTERPASGVVAWRSKFLPDAALAK